MLTMADSPSPLDAKTTGESPVQISTRSPGSPRHDSLCQRRASKTRARPSPYKNNRSPGSACTSSDESNPEQEGQEVVNEHHHVKRQAANCRERKRMHTVNSAFDQLRELVPTYPSNRKLSKIDTLRLACAYIQDLVSIVHNTQGIQGSDVSCLYQQGPDGFFASSSSGYSNASVHVKPELPPNDFQFAQYRMPNCMASDCASSDYSASESDNRSPPYFSQQSCAATGIGVRPPPLSRTSSDSVATRMAHASISTTHGCNAAFPANSRPVNCNIPSPLATHSVQHSASSPPPLLSTAQVSPPVWQRASSVPYTLYGQ